MIQATCSCGKSFRAKGEFAGKQVKCPSCGGFFLVPSVSNSDTNRLAEDSETVVCQCTCGKSYRAKASWAGRSLKCPACSSAIAIPETTASNDDTLDTGIDPLGLGSDDLGMAAAENDPLGLGATSPLEASSDPILGTEQSAFGAETDPLAGTLPSHAEGAWNINGPQQQTKKANKSRSWGRWTIVGGSAGLVLAVTLALVLSGAFGAKKKKGPTAQNETTQRESQPAVHDNDVASDIKKKKDDSQPSPGVPAKSQDGEAKEKAADASLAQPADTTSPSRGSKATAPDKAAGKTPDKAAGKTPDKAAGKTPDKAAGKTRDKAAGKTRDKAAENRLLTAGQQAARKGEFESAVGNFKQLLAINPQHSARISLVRVLHDQAVELAGKDEKSAAYALVIEAAGHYRKWREKNEPNNEIREFSTVLFYNAACGLARDGKSEQAVNSLKDALDAGFLNLDRIERSEDLDSIRELQAFKELIAEHRNKKLSPDDLVARASQLAQSGQVEAAIKDLEQLVAIEPRHNARLLLTEMLHDRGLAMIQKEKRVEEGYALFISAADHYREWRQGKNQSEKAVKLAATVFYNAACALSRTNRLSDGMQALRESMELGFLDLEQIEKDPDLDNLHGREFQQLVAEYRPRYEKRKREAVESLKRKINNRLSSHVPATVNLELPDANGKTIRLSDFKGKVVVVSFWSTEDFSRLSVPTLVALKKQLASRGLEVIGVNYNAGTDDQIKQTVSKFSKLVGLNYPSLFGDAETRKRLKIRGFPTTLFIDRTGKTRMLLEGPLQHTPAFLAGTIARLLDE